MESYQFQIYNSCSLLSTIFKVHFVVKIHNRYVLNPFFLFGRNAGGSTTWRIKATFYGDYNQLVISSNHMMAPFLLSWSKDFTIFPCGLRILGSSNFIKVGPNNSSGMLKFVFSKAHKNNLF